MQTLLQQLNMAGMDPTRGMEALGNAGTNGNALGLLNGLLLPGAIAVPDPSFMFPNLSAAGTSGNPFLPNRTGASSHSTDDNEMDTESVNGKPQLDSKCMLQEVRVTWKYNRSVVYKKLLSRKWLKLPECQRAGHLCNGCWPMGVRNSGKSCLAALIAKNSDIPNIHVYSPDDFLHMDEAAKVAKLHEIFKELSQFRSCILLLDDLEMLIGIF
ncbi:unnamed protein product [Gongylonema pulchrum]|uniref:ATPase_AAA_core domain-containing protein n=1 Tax=Gongylonema pulchrum TaxID=637853 RepID=A0A183EHY1_9BILA|nr:unnamed protein product [Gongylonema pulchrum]